MFTGGAKHKGGHSMEGGEGGEPGDFLLSSSKDDHCHGMMMIIDDRFDASMV